MRRSDAAIEEFRTVASPIANQRALTGLHQELYTLWSDETTNGLLRQLHERFILLVRPDDLGVGQRRIFTISYEEEIDKERGWFYAADSSLKAHGRSVVQQIGESFAWRYLLVRVRTRALFGAESYHVEFSVPEEIVIKHAELGTRVELIHRAQREREVIKNVVAREGQSERAHLYESGVSTAPPGTYDPVQVIASEVGYAEFGLALKPASLWPPLLAGAMTLLVLVAGLIVHRKGHSAPVEASTALLVVLPAAFAAYLLPGEHRLVRKMYRLLRVLVLVQGLLAYAAAGFFVVDFSGSTTYRAWLGLAGASVVLLLVVAVAVYRSWRRRNGDWVMTLPPPTRLRTVLPSQIPS
jgi:hypothetical protein